MQPALPFIHRPHYGSLEFLAAPVNEAARVALDADWPDERLALWGEAGCGKTHLLHLWAARHGVPVVDGPALLPPDRAPAVPIVVDRADAAPERALLHCLNAAREAGLPMLLASRAAPARWGTRLPDLASRLRATFAVRIEPADDTLLRLLLARLFTERQLRVAPPVQEWLLLRLPRTPGAIREAVARLDKAGLEAGRPITRALAAALGDLLPAEIEDDVLANTAMAASSSALPPA